MIGEDYFQLRAQLGTAIYALSTLAHDLEASPEALRTLHDLNMSLREPFLFVVVGEVKSGKSSLLNALFGREFCRVDVLPTTDRITVFKYGEVESDVRVSDHLLECYRPNDFLRDFNIVDTPGTNTIVPEHQTLTEQYLPMADLVLFVFSVTNPWAASAWDFLNLVHKKWLKQVVLVLQQSDLRNEVEVGAVVQHLQQTAQERLGARFPVFAVSAKKALLAKTTATDKEAFWEQSHFGHLERYINQAVAHGEVRIGKLRSVCQTAHVILRDLGEKARAAANVLQSDAATLAQVRADIAGHQRASLREMSSLLATLQHSYDEAGRVGEELLTEKLSLVSAIRFRFKKVDPEEECRLTLVARLRDSDANPFTPWFDRLRTDLKNVRRSLQDALRDHVETESTKASSLPRFVAERQRILQEIRAAIVRGMSEPGIDEQTQALFAATRRRRATTRPGASDAGAAEMLAGMASADVGAEFARIAGVFGKFVTVWRRAPVIQQFRARVEERKREVLSQIEADLQRATEQRHNELQSIFQPLEAFGTGQAAIFAPVGDRVRQLDEAIARHASELRVAPPGVSPSPIPSDERPPGVG